MSKDYLVLVCTSNEYAVFGDDQHHPLDREQAMKYAISLNNMNTEANAWPIAIERWSEVKECVGGYNPWKT